MHVEAEAALQRWLTRDLESLSDADPAALAQYIMALLKAAQDEGDALKAYCTAQLNDFLGAETAGLVARLFAAMADGSYRDGGGDGEGGDGDGDGDGAADGEGDGDDYRRRSGDEEEYADEDGDDGRRSRRRDDEDDEAGREHDDARKRARVDGPGASHGGPPSAAGGVGGGGGRFPPRQHDGGSGRWAGGPDGHHGHHGQYPPAHHFSPHGNAGGFHNNAMGGGRHGGRDRGGRFGPRDGGPNGYRGGGGIGYDRMLGPPGGMGYPMPHPGEFYPHPAMGMPPQVCVCHSFLFTTYLGPLCCGADT